MGIEEGRCRLLLLRRRRRPSISIYAFHILSARHCLLLPPPPSLVNRYSTYVRKINTLQRLPKPACSHLLHPSPPSRLSTSERRVNKFYMVEESRDIHAYRLSFSLHLFLSSSFLPFSPQSLNMHRHTASKQMDIAK